MKRIVLVTVPILVLAGVLYLSRIPSKGTVLGEMTDRAREFIQGRREENDKFWRSVFFGKEGGENVTPTPLAKQIGECFTITVPFEVFNQYEKGECAYYFATEDPKGKVNAYIREVGVDDYDDLPGVRLRREREYKEEIWDANGREYLVFKNEDSLREYEILAYNLSGRGLFTLSFIAYTNQEFEEKFREMLGSVEFDINN